MALWHRYASVAYGAVFMGVIAHASAEFVAKLSGVGGPEMSVWRFVLGGAGLVILALLQPQGRNLLAPFKTHGTKLLLLSLLGISLGYLLFHWSLDFANIIQVATIVTTVPIAVGLANLLINKEPFGGAKIISGICALLGVALLITDGYLLKLTGTSQNLIGVLMSLACAFIMGIYMVMVKPIVAQYGAMRITAITMFLGGIGLWLVVGLFWGKWVNPLALANMPGSQVTGIVVIALWNTTIAQFVWIGGLAAAPDITRGSYLFFLKPVIAAFLAVAIKGDPITGWEALAIVVICSSVLVEANWERLQNLLKGTQIPQA